MAPKKNNTRGRSSQNSAAFSTGVRSTAAIFANPDEKVDDAMMDEPMQPEASDVTVNEEKDDPSSYSFPLNYIFQVQDFLNDNLDLCKFVQLLVILYICEVIYLTCGEQFWEKNYTVIGFNLLGLSLALILGYQAQLKKHLANPAKILKPELPEFNHIYSVFIPLTITFLLKLDLLLVNLALNNFIIDYLHPIPKFISAVMFFQVYNENQDFTIFRMFQMTFMHFMLQYVITRANSGNDDTSTDVSNEVISEDDAINLELVEENNKKYKSGTSTTLNKAEIQLLCLMVTNLLFGLNEVKDFNLPLHILQKLIISLIICLAFVYPLFKIYESLNLKIFGVFIIAVFAGLFTFVTNYLLTPVLSNSNAVIWLWDFIFESEERLQILSAWGILLLVSIPAVFINSNKLSLNSRRKVWHYVILVMIAYPSLPKQPVFTIISLLGSIVVFITMEIVRYNRFTMLGEWLYQQLVIFQDFKDLKGPLNLSYIFLIIGVTIPIVFDYCIKHDLTCKSFIGIIGLGIGDSFASVIGKHYGTLKWKGSSKSVQGTAAFIIFSMVGFYLVDSHILTHHVHSWENLLVCCILGGVLEGVSNLNDNFLIPSVMYISLQALDNI